MTENPTYEIGVSRIRRLVFGKVAPSWYTQFVCISGLISGLLFLIWHALNIVALGSIDTMPDSGKVKVLFYKLGQEYGISDIFDNYYLMSIFSLAGAATVVTAFLLIWRKKMIGHLLLILGMILLFTSPIIFLGLSYTFKEQNIFEYGLPPLFIILIVIDYRLLKQRIMNLR